MLMSLSMSLGSPVVLMDQLLICSRAVGQSTILLTPVQFSHCARPSVQPTATRVISPLGSNVILRCDATGYPTPTLTWIKTSTYTGRGARLLLQGECTNICKSNNSRSDMLPCADCCQEAITEGSLQLPRFLDSCK